MKLYSNTRMTIAQMIFTNCYHYLIILFFVTGSLLTQNRLAAQAISTSIQEDAVVEGSPFSSSNLDANYGTIAMADNGAFVVAFQQKESTSNTNGTDIKFGVSTIDNGYGEVSGFVNTGRNYDQIRPKVAASADGSTFAIAWLSQTGTSSAEYDIYVKVYGSISGPSYSGTSDIKVNSSTIIAGYTVAIAMDANGDFVIAWADEDEGKIYAQRFNGAGTKQGSILTVDNLTGSNVYTLDVAMDATGEFVVTWYDERTEDSSGGVFAKKFNANATVQNATFLVNHITSGYQAGGTVGMSNSGEFIISYFNGTDHYYKKYEANGTQIGSPHALTDPSVTHAYIRSIGIDANLNYVLMFTDGGSGIYTKRYDWNDDVMGASTTIYTSGNYSSMAISKGDTEYAAFSRLIQITSSPVQYGIYAQRRQLCVSDPGVISGEVVVCPNEASVAYSIASVGGASNYTWTISDGAIATFTDGTTTKTTGSLVQLNFDATNTGSVTLDVTANGSAACGSSLITSDISITSSNISNPGAISGSSTVVENTLKSYSISTISGAVDYTWTLPSGASIDTDNGNIVTVEFGTASGDITVFATDDCGNTTTTATKSITVEDLDTTSPDILSLTPDHGASGVALNTNVYYIRFDETVSVSPGGFINLKTSGKGGGTVIATASTTSDVTNSGKAGWAIDFGSGSLVAGTTYFIEIPSGAFRDSQNNVFSGTTSADWSFTANRTPTDISLLGATVTDGDASGTLVGDFSATDADAGDTFTYTFVSGTGSDDNSLFSITDGQLFTAHIVDYESQTSYSIRVRVTDAAGATYDESMTVSVEDVDDSGPELAGSEPLDGAVDVDPIEFITLTFDESIFFSDSETVIIALKRVGLSNAVQNWIITSGTLPEFMSVNGNQITLEVFNNGIFFASDYFLESFTVEDNLGNEAATPQIDFTIRAALTGSEILDFSAEGILGSAIINTSTNTVNVTMSADAPVYVDPVFTLSEGAIVFGSSPDQWATNTIFWESGETKNVTTRSESGLNDLWFVTLTWPEMTGDYTIGANGYFVTLSEALDQLQLRGMSGDVNLLIMDGHEEQGQFFLDVDPFSGNDLHTTTVTVEDGATSASFYYFQFGLDGIQNLVVDGKGVLKAETISGTLFDLDPDVNGNPCRNITLKNLIGVQDELANEFAGGFVSGDAVEGLVIDNNTLTYENTGTIIRVVSPSSNVEVTNNRIFATDPDLLTAVSLSSTGNTTVINNTVSVDAARGSGMGVSNSDNAQIHYNTIYTNFSTSNQSNAGIYLGGPAGLEVSNNIIQMNAGVRQAGFYIRFLTDAEVSLSYNNIALPFASTLENYVEFADAHVEYGENDWEAFLANHPNHTNDQVFFTDAGNGDLSLAGISLAAGALRGTPLVGTTIDINGDTRSTFGPNKGAYEYANIATDILAFSVPDQGQSATIDPGAHTVEILLSEGSSTTQVPEITTNTGASINPATGISQDFSSPVVYTITAEEGNTQDWTVFATELDETAPVIASLSPANNADDVSSNIVELVVTFDEPIQSTGLSADAVIRRVSDNAEAGRIDTSDPLVTAFSGSTMTLTLPATLDQLITYYVTLPFGALEDLSGNDFVGYSNNTTWRFTTVDSTPPTIITFSPVNGAVSVANDEPIVLTFSEDIQLANNPNDWIQIRRVSNAQILHNIGAAFSQVEIDGNVVTITPAGGILSTEEEVQVYLSWSATPFEDLAGNDFNGLFGNSDYRFTVNNEPQAIVWDGSAWSNGTGPTASDDVLIDGTYTYFSNGAFTCDNLEVSSSGFLIVNVEGILVVNGDVVNNGDIRITSGSTLITYGANSISGDDIEIRRITRYDDGKYSFVGTPVEQSATITDADLGSSVYSYDEFQPYSDNQGLNRWIATAGELIPGSGYTQAFNQEMVFFGKPNDGTITYTGTYTEDVNDDYEGWNLVSNPYPAAIKVSNFLAGNMNTTGAIYIWDDNGSETGRGTNADYIVANGSVATNTTPAGGQSRYNLHLGSSQGFFVKLNDNTNTNIVFTEGMRVEGNNEDDHFFRKQEETPSYIRINFTDDQGLFKQAVLGWVEGISDESVDRSFDAPVFSTETDYSIYTLKADQPLAIQGVTFEKQDIPLGFNAKEAGTYQIEIDQSNFDGGALYLTDKQTEETIDLTQGSYNFNTAAGQFTDRFVLSAVSSVLSIDNALTDIYAFNKVLYINSEGSQPAQYRLYNLSGKHVMNILSSGITRVDLSSLPNGIYLVSDGIETKKIVLK